MPWRGTGLNSNSHSGYKSPVCHARSRIATDTDIGTTQPQSPRRPRTTRQFPTASPSLHTHRQRTTTLPPHRASATPPGRPTVALSPVPVPATTERTASRPCFPPTPHTFPPRVCLRYPRPRAAPTRTSPPWAPSAFRHGAPSTRTRRTSVLPRDVPRPPCRAVKGSCAALRGSWRE